MLDIGVQPTFKIIFSLRQGTVPILHFKTSTKNNINLK